MSLNVTNYFGAMRTRSNSRQFSSQSVEKADVLAIQGCF